MKPVKIVRSFSDLRDAIAEIAAATPPVSDPPMSPERVKRSAEVFAARHRREAGKVVRLVAQSETLLDHLVGGGQQRFRDGEAE
jgi:hypothetical protein